MCGITGFLNARNDRKRDDLTAIIEAMSSRLIHRGPDDCGTFVDESAGLALGFRRLAILDLSPDGHQPMRSRGRRYSIVFNGEIYNHLELAEELQRGAGRSLFRGHSDTEVILEAVERWGFDGAISRFQGMFAIALWDAETETLSLARDRMGEKPLYYGALGETFLFGSELKALRAHPAFTGAIDRASLSPYLAYGYVPAPRSIYENVKKLAPGTILQVRWNAGRLEERPAPYWSMSGARAASPLTGTDDERRDELDRILRQVISQQMIADVPLGAFLSGGVDSSTVVAIMQSLSPRPIKTFTIGFSERAYSEAHHARAVADHLGVDHTELIVSADDALATIPTLPRVFDEPFADSSQIPTMLVSKLARTQVTVSLSGDGADELFGGYDRYHQAASLWQKLGRIPQPIRAGVGKTFRWLPEKSAAAPSKAARLGRFLDASADPDAFYRPFVTAEAGTDCALVAGLRGLSREGASSSRSRSNDVLRRFMHIDSQAYLPDDILVKVDRASMAVGLESRAPFLDARVVEYAARLPSSMLVREGRGKWILREVLDKYVPKALVDRPKKGFGVPLGEWLQGPLRDWAGDLLNPDTLRAQGLLDPGHVLLLWDDHRTGKINRQYQLWNILMLQAWLESVESASGDAAAPELVRAA